MDGPAETAPTGQVAAFAVVGRELRVGWADGHHSAFHAVWLRDACPCPACCHRGTGQRLLETAAIPDDVAPASTRLDAEARLEITWEGGHVSAYPGSWLRAHCYCEAHAPAGRRWRSWRRAGRPGVPEARHADVVSDPRALHDWLAAVDRYGFALLRGVPAVPGEVTQVAELFAHVRETNYGRLFDVRAGVNPTNLAYTGLALSCHTDNPYRDPVPTLQLLHCVASSAEGGDSTLADGFEVAERLRERQPAAFELLARVPIRFRFRDAEVDLEAEHPVIALDGAGPARRDPPQQPRQGAARRAGRGRGAVLRRLPHVRPDVRGAGVPAPLEARAR